MADAIPSTPTASDAAPATPPVETTAPAPSTGESTAPSPSAPSQGETRESLLDVVQKAVSEPRTSQRREDDTGGVPLAPAATSETTATAPPGEPPKTDDDLPDEITDEELARYHPSAKRRVDKLISERRELRTAVDTQKSQIEQLAARMPQAEAAASVQKYLADNDIGKDDFLLTLELAAAMRRGDFRAFYEGVKPYVQLAEEYLGVTLPRDLQSQVANGQMTTEAARMFARERMDRGLAESQRIRVTQVHEQGQQMQARQGLAIAVRDNVNAWERSIAQSDPDYATKKPLLEQVMWSVVHERGAPQSPDAAVEIAQEAYRRVNEHAARWAPPRRPTSRTPSSTGRTNGAALEPKSLKEAVQQAIERARV